MFLGNLQNQKKKEKRKEKKRKKQQQHEEPSNKQILIQWMVSSSNMRQSPLIAVLELGLAKSTEKMVFDNRLSVVLKAALPISIALLL